MCGELLATAPTAIFIYIVQQAEQIRKISSCNKASNNFGTYASFQTVISDQYCIDTQGYLSYDSSVKKQCLISISYYVQKQHTLTKKGHI